MRSTSGDAGIVSGTLDDARLHARVIIPSSMSGRRGRNELDRAAALRGEVGGTSSNAVAI